jgi:hypothetical protein
MGPYSTNDALAISRLNRTKSLVHRALSAIVIQGAVVAALSLTTLPAAHSAVHCETVDREVSAIATIIPAHASGRIVISRVPVWVFTAPNGVCNSKAKALPRGAKLHAHLEYGGFTSMLYVDRDGNETLGWVQSIHLRADGTGVAPKSLTP